MHQNEQALVLRFGDPKQVIREPGLNWKMPFVETIEIFDKRILDLDTAEQEVTASDQKRIVVDAFARYKIVNPLLFYQNVRDERRVRLVLGPLIEFGDPSRARRRDPCRRGQGSARGADEARSRRR